MRVNTRLMEAWRSIAVDSKKFECGCRMIYGGCPRVCALALEGGPVPTFWLLLILLYRDLAGAWEVEL